MASNKVGKLFKQARYILQEEGLVPFVKRVFSFLRRFFFSYETYYIYKKILNETGGTEFTPRLQDNTLKIISTPSELDGLIVEGFDLSSYTNIENIEERLNKGAVLFCVFTERKLAHTSWVGMDNKVRIDMLPLAMDYQNEAYIGDCVTRPQYRGLELYPYTLYKIAEFLKGKGKKGAKITAAKDNAPSHKAITKARFEIYGEGRYLKLLLWKLWKEKPVREKQKDLSDDSSL